MGDKLPTAGTGKLATSATPTTRMAVRRRLLVCIDEDQKSVGAIPHAQTIAEALGGNVILLQVVEVQARDVAPLDPVDWEIRRRKASALLDDLARTYETSEQKIQIEVLEGRPIDQICGFAARYSDDITTFGRVEGAEGIEAWRTARSLADSDIGSILMVPSQAFTTEPKRYSCVFVSLDGSSTAESVIPCAAAIATAQNARLVVCHVVPDPSSINIGLEDSELQDLQVRLVQRAKKAAREYLGRIKDMLKGYGSIPTAMMIVEGDARQSLLNTIKEEGGDLLIMASHGHGRNPDLRSGHVASFILDHAEIPVLMIRPQRKSGDAHVYSDTVSKGTRHPHGAET